MDEKEYYKLIANYSIDTDMKDDNTYLLSVTHLSSKKKFEITINGEDFYLRPGDIPNERHRYSIRAYVANILLDFERSLTKDITLF